MAVGVWLIAAPSEVDTAAVTDPPDPQPGTGELLIRFDSPACFAVLLHDESAGRWRIAPQGAADTTRRRYRDDTLILETDMGCRTSHGSQGPGHRLVRRPGRAGTAGTSALSPVPMRSGCGPRSRSAVTTTAPSRSSPCGPVERMLGAELSPERFWREWIARCDYDGRWPDAVRRSLLLLKALTYAPTGGILAAATTSLPEQLGGSRNWDYRYCWLRDATFTLQALLGTGYVAEAKQWREWLLRAVAGDPADLQIMYGLDGTRRLPEYTLDWLDGYQGAGPVRVGNAAAGQLQLDVWGEVLDSLHLSREAGIAATDAGWDLQRALLDFLEGNWHQPDNSLWEMRGPRRHFVHSKVLAWAGFDRAVTAVERHGLDGPVDKWRALRDEIHADVCANGFDTDRNTFTQSYGKPALDAALLLIPRTGFLPATDPRVVGTVRAVQQRAEPRTVSCCATAPTAPTATACPAPRVLSWPARSGSSMPCTPSGARTRPNSSSNGCCPCATVVRAALGALDRSIGRCHDPPDISGRALAGQGSTWKPTALRAMPIAVLPAVHARPSRRWWRSGAVPPDIG